VNTGAPSIPPTSVPGDVVKCNPGTWTGAPAFSFQWLRNGTVIAGAAGQFFVVSPADVGQAITCQVAATNAGGSASAISNIMRPHAPPVTIAGLPPAQGCVAGGLNIGVGVRSAGLQKVTSFIDGRRVSVSRKAHFRLVVPGRKIGSGRHVLRILASYKTGTLNKRFSFVRCRGGGKSPAIRIGGAPSRTVCRTTPFTFHALIKGAVPASVRLTLDGKPLAKPGKLNFFRTIDVPPLSAGPHEALVIARDKFGNRSRDAIDFLRC
jgi:hypothetical protein